MRRANMKEENEKDPKKMSREGKGRGKGAHEVQINEYSRISVP